MNEIRVRGLDEGPFKAAVLEAVSRIPSGHVADFADIAEAIGYSRDAAPLVSWVIEGEIQDAPWHRVVGTDGSLPAKRGVHPIVHASLLGDEGVEVLAGPRVDLTRYRSKPSSIGIRFRGPIASSR